MSFKLEFVRDGRVVFCYVRVPYNVSRFKNDYILLLDDELVCRSKSLRYVLLLYQLSVAYGKEVVESLVAHGDVVSDVTLGRGGNGLPRNIYRTPHNTFSIRKQINGVRYRFGTYKSLEKAVEVKRLLVDNGWVLPYNLNRRGLPSLCV